MRVLHVHSGNLFGGVERLLVTLAAHQALAAGVQPEYALCFGGRLAEELRATGVKLHRLPPVRVRWWWTVWRARRALDRVLRVEGGEAVLVHSAWGQALFGPVAKRRGVPLVLWVHAPIVPGAWLERWAARCPPAGLLFNSEFTASASARYPQTPRAVLYYPVAAPPATAAPAAREATRAQLGVRPEGVVLLMASRLEAWKGHSALIAALALLEKAPDWHCWIAGGPQRPAEHRYLRALQARVATAGLATRVRFLGQRADVPALLVAADIFCQPNTGPEPFGIVFVEALLAGRPVVGTALGGPLEIVDDSCGCLVPPGDCRALAATLERLIHDGPRRAQLGRAGPARARALCDPARQMARLAEFLARLGNTVATTQPAS